MSLRLYIHSISIYIVYSQPALGRNFGRWHFSMYFQPGLTVFSLPSVGHVDFCTWFHKCKKIQKFVLYRDQVGPFISNLYVIHSEVRFWGVIPEEVEKRYLKRKKQNVTSREIKCLWITWIFFFVSFDYEDAGYQTAELCKNGYSTGMEIL